MRETALAVCGAAVSKTDSDNLPISLRGEGVKVAEASMLKRAKEASTEFMKALEILFSR